VRRALVGVLWLSACFGPRLDYQNGALGCDDKACPPGYECRTDLHCWLPGGSTPPIDAPIVTKTIDASIDVCSGSDRSCATPTQPQHCEAGAWVADPACDVTAPVCDNGQCGAGCTAPATRCLDERTPQSCNPSGFWDTLPTCMYACTGSGDCTGECVPKDKECRNGNELWACGLDGKWGLSKTCDIVCEDADCGGDCALSQTRCNPTTPSVPQTCNGGHWQDQAPCTYACLPSGTCAPDCDPAGPGTCIDGNAYHCDTNGRWALSEPCTTNCSAGTCTGTCHDGDKQCSGVGNRTPQTCTGGTWGDGTPCEFICDQGSCVVTECHPNVDKKCENGIPYSCDATGKFVPGPACSFVCDGDHCGGICKPGTFRCNGSVNLEKCAPDGKSYVPDHACPFGCSGNQCNACTPDSMTQTCHDKCGTVLNNCGASVDCGDSCTITHGPNWSCGSMQTCVCSRNVPADCSGKCGTITDRCGFSVDCSAAGSGGLACNAVGQLCQPDHSCCTPDPLGTTCSGDPGADCNNTVANNCGVSVMCDSTCDDGFICSGNPATPKKCSCAPGNIRCVAIPGMTGMTQQTCDGGLAWDGNMSCPFVCIDGMGCSGSCVPMTTQCSDATHVQTCQANGTFGAPTLCAAACRPSTNACGGVCVPGTQMCGTSGGSAAVLKCDSEGQWTLDHSCPGTCNNNICCEPDQTFCATGRWCDSSHVNNCGLTVDCTNGGINDMQTHSCASRFPGDHYGCGTHTAGECTCVPGTTSTAPCDLSSCDDNGNWVPEGCDCCCSVGPQCLTPTVCQHRGGSC
jgi:hypothetical protein